MPYGGKPSSGCFLCRQRRVKCDEREHGCANCAKIGKGCPGYRIKSDAIFRYENESVAKRSADAEEKGRAARAWDRASRPATESASLRIPDLSELLFIEDLAVGSFFAHFVTRSPWHAGSYASEMNDALLSAIKPVGLVAASRARGRPSLTPAAQSLYIRAIATTNQALCSSAAMEDATLLAVMLLGMFETMTGCAERSMEAWRRHINGAAALLQIRGTAQLNSINGRHLFVSAVSSLMIDCLRQRLPLPRYIHEATAELSIRVNEKDPIRRFLEAGGLTVDFLSYVWQGGVKECEPIVLRALQLDILCLSVFSEASCEWAYTIVDMERGNDGLPGQFHIYKDYRSAQLWNCVRVMRVLLHEVICKHLDPGSDGFDSTQSLQADLSTSILRDLHGDILASIPQHLGHVSRSTSSLPENYYGSATAPATSDGFLWSNFPKQPYTFFNEASISPSVFSSIQTFGGYALPWGLYLVGRSNMATPCVRKYVADVLRGLGTHMGILQAAYLADDL